MLVLCKQHIVEHICISEFRKVNTHTHIRLYGQFRSDYSTKVCMYVWMYFKLGLNELIKRFVNLHVSDSNPYQHTSAAADAVQFSAGKIHIYSMCCAPVFCRLKHYKCYIHTFKNYLYMDTGCTRGDSTQ